MLGTVTAIRIGMTYDAMMTQMIKKAGASYDVRLVEEVVRTEYSTLDHLTRTQLGAAVRRAVKALNTMTAEERALFQPTFPR